ncbi:MAG: hypothetical protein FLDDKLPJ_02941 [Phycisphaerae bacterium]|nr:hypothetical protein [Phycisphaerae bacterium]
MFAVACTTFVLFLARQQPPPAPAPAPQTRAAAPSQDELEREFQRSLSGVALVGTFRMIGKGLNRDETRLSDPIDERYVISEVSKVVDDSWMIKARIQYADRDVEVPVVVRIAWAGDTPVITLDNVSIPLVGTYSARVMIYRGFYSGCWFGAGYGGIMSGQIVPLNQAAGDPPASSSKPPDGQPKPSDPPAKPADPTPQTPTPQPKQ